MKGQDKIKRGSGALGLLSYMTAPDEHEFDGQIVGGNMSGTDAESLASEFGISRRIRPGIKKPIWHNSLRLPKGDTQSLTDWEAQADDYMKRMGFTELHQRVYVMHNDPDGQHIHIAASRIALDGTLYLGKNENLISTKIISQLEKDYKLTLTKGADYDEKGNVIMRSKSRPAKSEVEKAIRKAEQPERIQLQNLLDQALIGKPTVSKFCDHLALSGVVVLPNVSLETKRLNGFSFKLEDGEVPFSGSKLGAYALKDLQKKGVTYDENRDFEQLAELRRANTPLGVYQVNDELRETTRRSEPASVELDSAAAGEGSARRAKPICRIIDRASEPNGGAEPRSRSENRDDHQLAASDGKEDGQQPGRSPGLSESRDSGEGQGRSAAEERSDSARLKARQADESAQRATAVDSQPVVSELAQPRHADDPFSRPAGESLARIKATVEASVLAATERQQRLAEASAHSLKEALATFSSVIDKALQAAPRNALDDLASRPDPSDKGHILSNQEGAKLSIGGRVVTIAKALWQKQAAWIRNCISLGKGHTATIQPVCDYAFADVAEKDARRMTNAGLKATYYAQRGEMYDIAVKLPESLTGEQRSAARALLKSLAGSEPVEKFSLDGAKIFDVKNLPSGAIERFMKAIQMRIDVVTQPEALVETKITKANEKVADEQKPLSVKRRALVSSVEIR
jgi:hypothetical protein